jgi:hypothetical protein
MYQESYVDMWNCGFCWMAKTSSYLYCDAIAYTLQLNPSFDPIRMFARFMPDKAAVLADRVLTELVKVCATVIPQHYYFDLVWSSTFVDC